MDLKKKQLDDRVRKALVSLKVEKSNISSFVFIRSLLSYLFRKS